MAIGQFTLADEEFKSAFVEGKFVIDCLEIKLTQNGKPEPKNYVASGYLLVSADNGAEARLVFPRKEGEPIEFVSLRRAAELKSGQMIPESHYFMLEATDVGGRVWTHPAATVKFEEASTAVTITVSCDYVRCEQPLDTSKAWTHMVFAEEIEFPMNLPLQASFLARGQIAQRLVETASSGSTGALNISYDSGKGRTSPAKFSELHAAAVDGAEPPERFEERLLEAVRFATATLCWPIMTETVREGRRVVELSKARPARRSGLINPPIKPRGHAKDFYDLLRRYYDYALGAGSGDELSPLSQKLGGLFTLQNVWLDTIALVVSVAIESVLQGDRFAGLKPKDPKLEEQIGVLRAAVAGSAAETSFRERGVKQIEKMGEIGTKQKLAALAQAGALDGADPDTWLRLRNKAAHGALHVDPAETQSLLDTVFRSVTILYKLAFLEIGYAGNHTNFSNHGWATQRFDAAASWAAAAALWQPACVVKAPSDCGEKELGEFVNLVASGGEVAQKGLTARVRGAKLLAFLRLGSKLIGVAGLKLPTSGHRKEVAEGAGVELPDAQLPYELGWVFVAPEARGGKSMLLCQPLIDAAGGAGVFATARVDNLPMLSTLGKLGFKAEGGQWPSKLGDAQLCLRARPAPSQSS